MLNDIVWDVSASRDDFAKLDPSVTRTLLRCKTCLSYEISSLNELSLAYIPDNVVLSWIYDTNVTLISTGLLNALTRLAAIEGLFETGRMVGCGTIPIRFKYKYQIRGTTDIGYYRCPACGRESYLGYGERFLIAKSDRFPPVCESGPGSFLALDFIKSHLEVSEIRGLNFEMLTFRNSPADSLSEILGSERRLT